MPELAEVEYLRHRWDPGIGAAVCRVAVHFGKRCVRDLGPAAVEQTLSGTKLLGSEAQAKQMLFAFGRGRKPSAWVGIHLGMTGELRVESADFAPGKHDHFVLLQRERALVFTDPRMFGRVRFHAGAERPEWWTSLPPAVLSSEFTRERLARFLSRRSGTPVKALLLMQDLFPGVGNWMADEILWRCRIHPNWRCGRLNEKDVGKLWRESREVCRVALATVAVDFGDPPKGWFFHVRWTAQGRCPRCDIQVKTATIGSRTTRWCPNCQPAKRSAVVDARSSGH
jgi:formamidopyrimidine-DNA glycosylase